MENHTFIISRLVDLIEKKGLTKKDFCNAVDISSTTFANMQNKEDYEIGVNKLAAIADYFGVSMDYFFDRESAVKPIGHKVTGNGNNIKGDILISQQASEIVHLKELLNEKERTIQILLNNTKQQCTMENE